MAENGDVVGGDAAPPREVEVFQIGDQLGMSIAQLDPIVANMFSHGNIKIKIFGVPRPDRRSDRRELRHAIRPLLSLEVVNDEFHIIDRNRGQVFAVRRPGWREVTLGSENCGDLL